MYIIFFIILSQRFIGNTILKVCTCFTFKPVTVFVCWNSYQTEYLLQYNGKQSLAPAMGKTG